jgi:PST family polysaccharide transporter
VYIVLARLLAPSEFGVFAAASVFVGLTILFTESGFVSAVVQRRDRFEEAANTALVATLVNGVVFALLALAVAPLLGLFFEADQVTSIAAAMSGVVLLRIASAVPDAILQRRFSFLRRLAIEPAQVLAFGTAAIIGASNGMGAWALVLGTYAGTAVDVVLSWALVRWRPAPRLASMAMWRELVGFGRHVFVATAILRAGELSDTLIVGRVLGSAALGQFRYAFRLAAAPFMLLLATASYVLFPAFARIAHDPERHQPAFLRSLRWMSILGFPAGLILIPMGVPIAVVVFGEVWRDAGEAAMAMCLYTGASMVTSVVSEALKAHGTPNRLVRMHTVTTVVTAGSMLALSPLGLTAAAAGMSIGSAAGAVFAVRTAHRTLAVPWRDITRQLAGPAFAALVMAFAVLPLELAIDAESHATAPALALLAAEAAVCTAVFLGVLRVIAPAAFAELPWAIGSLRRRLSRRGTDPTPTP